MKNTPMMQMPLLEPEHPQAQPHLPVGLLLITWCRECRRKPGTCRKSVKGRCQATKVGEESFGDVAQCAKYILSPAFDCDEASVFVTSENDNPPIICAENRKTSIPVGGYAVDVVAWAKEVLA
jgi:hypothetical protein